MVDRIAASLTFDGALTGADIARAGRARVYASSQHPIALASMMAMTLPLGIYLIRQPGNRILNNTVIGSTVAGVDLADGAGVVSDNIVQANHLLGGGSGIRFSAGWTGNRFVGNRIEANVCGTKGSTAGNTLNGNVFSDNTTDACP